MLWVRSFDLREMKRDGPQLTIAFGFIAKQLRYVVDQDRFVFRRGFSL